MTDPNGGVTTYTYDGFGELIQRVSPDSGTTVYRYDLDGNLAQKTDATGAIVNYTYDALDRLTKVTYPADAAETAAFNYDQSGFGFSIGKLTTVTDAVGSPQSLLRRARQCRHRETSERHGDAAHQLHV